LISQKGIGKGLITEKALEDIYATMLKVLNEQGIQIRKICCCLHGYEKEECECRKPKIGMALSAKKDFPDIDFSKSIMVGDSEIDLDFCKNALMVSF
jgi:D-glycero-D-manno-heptose 1,7-bisphosphate phosphatase